MKVNSVIANKLRCVVVIWACLVSATTASAAQQSLQMTPHEIFQNRYSQSNAQSNLSGGENKNRIKQTVERVKKLARLSLSNRLQFKVSDVQSGPLSQEITTMEDIAPGIQTHEGRLGDPSKGYGIEFSFKF